MNDRFHFVLYEILTFYYTVMETLGLKLTNEFLVRFACTLWYGVS